MGGGLSSAQQDDRGERPAFCRVDSEERLNGSFRPVYQIDYLVLAKSHLGAIVGSVAGFPENHERYSEILSRRR